MGKFEEKEMKKIRPVKNTWYDWLVNYIPEPVRKSAGDFKDKVISLFKTNTPKQTVYGRGKTKTQKQSEGNIINSIRNLFILKTRKKESKDIKTLFEQEDDNYYKLKKVTNFWNYNYTEYESNGDSNKNLSLEEYLDKIRPYLRDIIIDPQESDTWKIQLTIATNFISSKDAGEERVMQSKSGSIEFISYNDTHEFVDEILKTIPSRYQENLKMKTGRSEYVFDSIQLLYYKCHRINFRRGGLYIDSPD